MSAFLPTSDLKATLRTATATTCPETLMIGTTGRGVLDRPVKPGDDSEAV
jgi:hypothetical protein